MTTDKQTSRTHEHHIIAKARRMDLHDATAQLMAYLIGSLREAYDHRGLVTEYRDAIAAHAKAEDILREREEEARAAHAPKPEAAGTEEQIADARRLIFFEPFRDLEWVSRKTGLTLEVLRGLKKEALAKRAESFQRIADDIDDMAPPSTPPGQAAVAPRPTIRLVLPGRPQPPEPKAAPAAVQLS